MLEPKQYRLRFVLGVFGFVLIMMSLGWIVGNSYWLAIIGIIGWLVFLGFLINYVSRYSSKS